MKNMLRIAAFVISVFFAGSLYASFAETHGLSASAIARGNAVTATVNDWSSVFYNLAGLGRTLCGIAAVPQKDHYKSDLSLVLKKDQKAAEVPGASAGGEKRYLNDQLALNFFYTMPGMQLDIPRDGVKATDELDYGTIAIGIVMDLNHFYRMPDFISSARFGLGLGTMADGSIVKVNDIDIRTHDWVNYGREAQRIVILAGLGFGFLNDMFGIGVGASVLTGGEGAVLMRDVEVGPEPQTPDQQAKMDLTTTVAPMAGIYFSPGKLTNVLKGLEIGASYRGEIHMEIDPFRAGTSLAVPASLTLVMTIFDYYTPDIFNLGISYNMPFHDRLTVEIDAEYQMWSKHQVSESRRKYWEEGGFGGNSGEPYYLNVKIPKFNDVIVPKLGITYRVFDWLSAMAGYSYQQSFIPDDALTGIFNMLDNDRHIASLGVRFLIPPVGGIANPLEIVVAGQYQMLVKRDVVKDYSYLNDAAYTPEELDEMKALNPDYSFGGSVWSATIEVKLRW